MTWIVVSVILFLIALAGYYGFRVGAREEGNIRSKMTGENDRYYRDDLSKTKYVKVAGLSTIVTALVLFLLVTVFSMTYTLDSRQVGVIRTFGAITQTQQDDGFHLKKPWEKVEKYSIATKREQFESSAVSSETQDVSAVLTLNYSVNPEGVESLARRVGPDWETVLIPSQIQQAFKESTVLFRTIEIAPNRARLRQETEKRLADLLDPYGIRVDDILVDNLGFPEALQESITNKQVAQQNAIAAAQLIRQRKNEADAAIEQARGQAVSNRLLAESLRTKPELLQVRLAEERTKQLQELAKSGKIQLLPSNVFFTQPAPTE